MFITGVRTLIQSDGKYESDIYVSKKVQYRTVVCLENHSGNTATTSNMPVFY